MCIKADYKSPELIDATCVGILRPKVVLTPDQF